MTAGGILVTGAGGMLGCSLIRAWRPMRSVFGTSATTEIPGVVDWCGDLSEPGIIARVLDEARPHLVIHAAAWTDVDGCECDPARAWRLNVDMTTAIAKEVESRGAQLVYISTEAVFDGKRGGYLETDAPNPVNEYARTKLAGENAAMAAHPKALVLRVGLEGWRVAGKPGFAQWVIDGVRAGEPRNIVTDWIHTPVFAGNVASIIDALVEAKVEGIVHVGTREPASNWDLATEAARVFELDARKLNPIHSTCLSLKASRPRDVSLDTTKLQNLLGSIVWDLETALFQLRNDESGVAALRRQMAS